MRAPFFGHETLYFWGSTMASPKNRRKAKVRPAPEWLPLPCEGEAHDATYNLSVNSGSSMVGHSSVTGAIRDSPKTQ